MEKELVAKLVTSNSDRITMTTNNNAVSDVWAHFKMIKIDGKLSSFIHCDKCSAVLKWKPRDGTSTMKSHIKACNKHENRDRTLTDMACFTREKRPPAVSAADKSELTDKMVLMCAKDIR
jgi:hypothetical protein